MPTRLPIPGQDHNTWGDILNNYLLVAHSQSGTLKSNSVGTSQITDSSVTQPKLADNIVSLNKLTPDLRDQVLNSTGGGEGGPGQDGTDGREVELRATSTHIQWRYEGTPTWTNLVALDDIRGPQGNSGPAGADSTVPGPRGEQGERGERGETGVQGPAGNNGTDGAPGAPGQNGRELELSTSSTHIRWRLQGETSWNNLIALSELGGGGGGGTPGEGGREIELRATPTHIQWRYLGDTEWTNLIPLTELRGERGEKGDKGDPGDQGPQGPAGQAGEQGPAGPAGADSTVPGPAGPAGDAGPRGEIGEKGDRGDVGPRGEQGEQGPAGEQGAQGPAGQGIPTGGTVGQILAKASGANYATEWITPQFGGGGGDGGIQHTPMVVAANDAPAHIKASANYVCDGVADEVQINQAIADLSNDIVSANGNGGIVQLWGRSFTVAGPILLRSHITVQGFGKFNTWVTGHSSYTPGENAGIFQLYSADSQYTLVRELTVNGGSSQCCGFYYSQGIGQAWDAAHSITDVYVRNTFWHGAYLTWNGMQGARNRAYFMQNFKILNSGRDSNPQAVGMWLDSADCILISVDAGSSCSHGFRISGANNRLFACAGWFSGSSASGRHEGSGYYVTGARNQFIGCKAQDNYGDGFHLRGSDHTLSGCHADSNGHNREGGNGAGIGWTGSGYYLQGYNLRVDGNAMDKNEGNRGQYQQYHVETGRSNVAAIVTVVTGGLASVQKIGGPAFHSTAVVNVVGV